MNIYYDVGKLIDALYDNMEVIIDGEVKDCSFDHEFGTENCYEYEDNGIEQITLDLGKKSIDVTDMPFKEVLEYFIDDSVSYECYMEQIKEV